jgi:pilus assembly protein CpaB
MRFKPIIMIVLAVVFGGSAMVAGNSWLKRQAEQQRPIATLPQEAAPTATIVVASSPLRYGDELTGLKLKQVPWHGEAAPAGAFATVAELTRAGSKRIALAAIEPNEPILQSKITGDGQRATLSALLEDGMGAVTIHVDEVIGLAGFVLPGDRVDVFATQQPSDDNGQGSAFNERILQNVRVLAVGQTADERADKPAVVRAVTIEVDPRGAQKIALAARSSSLSLMLRKAGETAARSARRVVIGEIGNEDTGESVNVRVTRGARQTSYAVHRMQDPNTNVAAGQKGGEAADPVQATGNIKSSAAAR